MPNQALSSAARKFAPSSDDNELTPDQKRRIAKFGIGFDGRYYRYRDYRYDRLADALNYAELDSARPGWQALDVAPPWLEPHRPSEVEQALMEKFGMAFDGRYYLYKGYRYDRCSDALNYARLGTPD